MTMADSSEHNRLMAQLEQRMLARAAPRLAHDFNNDLTIIGGQAELAQRAGDQRLHDRMEQIKLAARNARERNQLLQELAHAEADTGTTTSGETVTADVKRLADVLAHRDMTFAASSSSPLPAVDRTRLRWITGALLMAAQPTSPTPRGSITLTLSPGGGGLRLEGRVQGSGLPDWLAPTLTHCATAADVVGHEDGWQATVILAAAI
ncbi:MAG: HAMP domain-containing histidine kinase [Gammaproteobacteria bacterium]|nr:HAMP domain-containing histidine kinase [Gammaproteobacteria bacterium]